MLLTHRTNLRESNTARDRVGDNESDVLVFWLLSNSAIYKHSCCWHTVESLNTLHDDFLSTGWKRTLNRAGEQQCRINKPGTYCSNICRRPHWWFAYGAKLYCTSAKHLTNKQLIYKLLFLLWKCEREEYVNDSWGLVLTYDVSCLMGTLCSLPPSLPDCFGQACRPLETSWLAHRTKSWHWDTRLYAVIASLVEKTDTFTDQPCIFQTLWSASPSHSSVLEDKAGSCPDSESWALGCSIHEDTETGWHALYLCIR